MTSASQPEQMASGPTAVELAHMDLMAVLNNPEVDTLPFTPTMDAAFLPDEDQAASLFPPQDYSMNGHMAVPADNERDFTGPPGEPVFQNSAPLPFGTDMHSPLHFLVTQVQSLANRVQYLEASLQQSSETVGFYSLRLQYLTTSVQKTSSTVDDLTSWSHDMEKHYREQNRMMLDLTTMVQRSDPGVGDEEDSATTPTM
ncbi:hypothetical protein ACHAO5_001666 [Verticillium nonalfalfae]